MEEIKSNVPVMRFCEYCWATLLALQRVVFIMI